MKICPWPVCMSYTKDILSAQPVSTFDLNHITGYQKYLYNKIILKQLLLTYKNISKQFKINALVIFVTTDPHPRDRAGDSCGNEHGFDQSFATAVRGKYPGFALCRQKGL